jgi:hypothetical protein
MELRYLLAVHQSIDLALRIFEVAKDASLLVAGFHAERLPANGLPILAEITLHRRTSLMIRVTRTVWARHDAGLAANTLALLDKHNSVLALLRCASWAAVDAWRLGTMHTKQRKMAQMHVGKYPGRTNRHNRVIDHVNRQIVVSTASHGTGFATNTTPCVNDHRIACHLVVPLSRAVLRLVYLAQQTAIRPASTHRIAEFISRAGKDVGIRLQASA